MFIAEGSSEEVRDIVLNIGADTFSPTIVKVSGREEKIWEKLGVFDQKLLYDITNMKTFFPSNFDQKLLYDITNIAGDFEWV